MATLIIERKRFARPVSNSVCVWAHRKLLITASRVSSVYRSSVNAGLSPRGEIHRSWIVPTGRVSSVFSVFSGSESPSVIDRSDFAGFESHLLRHELFYYQYVTSHQGGWRPTLSAIDFFRNLDCSHVPSHESDGARSAGLGLPTSSSRMARSINRPSSRRAARARVSCDRGLPSPAWHRRLGRAQRWPHRHPRSVSPSFP